MFIILLVLVKDTASGPQPYAVSFVKEAVAVFIVTNCCTIESDLQPNGLMVTNFISTVSPAFAIVYPGKTPVALMPNNNPSAYQL